MTRDRIEQFLYLMDEAFEAGASHSLLSNIKTLRPEDWQWTPPGGMRSVFQIVQHVGECKYVYDNHAFGDRSMRWDRPGSVPTVDQDAPPDAIIDWLRGGHRRLRGSLGALQEDEELLRLRWANWGRQHETRWLVNAMIQHDLYHAGEINHLRALSQGNDRWAYDV